ncbi:MAG: hypothetical protein DRN91_09270 [Candidatus Alkanophagales archaeon]|nr:MAG: hypothetical protein DRN91_09270 [Candidatus Alkanophagales archaeon]
MVLLNVPCGRARGGAGDKKREPIASASARARREIKTPTMPLISSMPLSMMAVGLSKRQEGENRPLWRLRFLQFA